VQQLARQTETVYVGLLLGDPPGVEQVGKPLLEVAKIPTCGT
jgi:hypothetical protein